MILEFRLGFICFLLFPGLRCTELCIGLDCLNGGTVSEEGGLCHCLCPPRFSGLTCDFELKESSWPRGPFFLLMPMEGCPETKAQGWEIGYINITTAEPFEGERVYDTARKTWLTLDRATYEGMKIRGPYGLYNLQMNFCFKTADHSLTKTENFPDWSIEVFGSDEGCPSGFEKDYFLAYFPPILTWNADGYTPSFEVRQGQDHPRNHTEIFFTLCKRIQADSDVVMNVDVSYIFIQNPESKRECGITGLSIRNINYPIKLSGYFSNHSELVSLEFCYFDPYNKFENTRIENEETDVLFTTNNIKIEVACISGLLTYRIPGGGGLSESRCNIMTWIVIDVGMSVMVSGIYMLHTDFLTTVSDTNIFIERHRWGILHHGAAICYYEIENFKVGLNETETSLKCNRVFEGRYVTLLSQWKYANTYPQYKEQLSAANIYVSVLSSDNPDVNGMLHTPCSIKMGMEDRSIQKFQITASSSETGFPPYNARPDLSGWCALLTDEKPYIQVDLLVTTVVDGITIFNWNETTESIISNTYQATISPVGSRSFQLTYGSSLDKFVPYNNRSFQIDTSLKYNTEHHFVLYKPFVARYIRVYPLAIGTLPCLKFELYGCRKQGQPSVYCRNDNSAELFTDIRISQTFVTRFAGYTDTQAEECFNKCINETDKCSFFEYYRNFTSYRYMCNLYSTDEFKPLSGNDKFFNTQAKSSREIFYEKAFGYSAYRGIFMCWRNTTQFQVPRLKQRYTGLIHQNMSVILSEHQREAIFNPGYPFYYDAPQIVSWAIHADNYIKIAFLDVSLKRPDNDNPCFINIATNKKCSNDVILLFKKQIDFGLLNNIEDGDLSIDYNSNGFNPMIRTDVRSLYMYFWTYRHEGEGRGFRALLFSEGHPDCGLPDWDQVYRCYEDSVRFASPELWQIPHSANKYRFLYQPSNEDGNMPNIKVTFEVFDVSCNTGSSFTIKGHWVNTKICNRNKPHRPMLLRLEMEVTFTVATNREPYYPLEGFQILAQQINRENSSEIPSSSFFGNIVFECFDEDCFYSVLRLEKELCVDQFSKCYTLYSASLMSSWSNAAVYCEKRGGYLLSLQSKEEMKYIQMTLLEFSAFTQMLGFRSRSAYLGLSRYFNSEGAIEERWADGSPLTFTAWFVPDDSLSVQFKGVEAVIGSTNCTILYFGNVETDKLWYRVPCSVEVYYFICEERFHFNISTDVDIDIDAREYPDTGTDLYDIRHMLFECSEDEFVSPLSVCNGVVECSNNEDELHCKEERNCTKNYFQCTDGECIHSSKVCDFRQDCADNSDEYCEYPPCSLATEFECTNYQCIPKYQRCDAVPHCVDGSDEKDCANCNISVAFPCTDKRCIPRELLFDNHPDCLSGEDEEYGSFYKLHSCDDVLLAGIRESGIYYIAGRWTECIFDFDKQTITTISNIDWSPGFEDRSIFLIPSMSDYNGYICSQTFHLDLPISRTMLSQDNSLSEWKEKSIKLIGNSTEAILRGTLINRDEFTGNVQVSFGTNYNRQKLAFGIGPITCVKNLTGGIRTSLIVPEYISAHVTKGTEWRNLTSCGLLAKPIFTKRSCVFDVDGQKPVEGCRSLEHLQNCEFINCEPHYYKCPGSFCIPYHFVCDGRIHCPDSFDERNCSSGARIKGILIYYIGKDAEIEDAAHNLASQMFSEDTHIQIFYTDKHNIKMTENGQSSEYLVRTYNVLSMTALSKKYKKEYNISMDNFESDVEKLIRFNGTNETFSVFLQNGELRKKEEDLFHKFDETLATRYRFRIEKDGSFYKNLQVSMSKDGKTKYLKLNNWKLLRSGGTLLFPEIFSANHGCHNAFRCSFSHVCLPFEQVCDGRKHCPHGDDEDLCHFVCPNNCTCEGYSSSCPSLQYNVFNSISSLVRILDINHCKGLNGTLDIKTDLYFLIELNVSFSNIRVIHNESFAHTRNILILDLSYNLLTFIQKEIFKDLRFIRILLLEGNELISTIEPNAFYGLGLKHLSVTHTMLQVVSRRIFNGFNATKLDLSYNTIETIEDNAFEGLHVEELDITFNPIKNFGKAMFTGVTGLQKLKTPMYKFCCMRPIYLEENKCFPHQDEFSSCGDLMRRTSLQFLLWIIAVLAIVGNILSVVFRMVFDKKRIKMVYGIFVTNLAFSDMLMGFYMLIIAIADRLYHDRYIEEDERWRSSGWCSLAGIMSTVSSEASVLFVCLITIDRLLVIKYPFGSFKISTRQAKIVVSICWSICLIVAVIPIIESKYFGNQFYSKSGVCLALPLSKERSPGWLYSVLIFIGFNFVTFILIALGQILIFCEVRRAASTMKKKSSARRNDLKVARNLLLLVGTDFACWFPIGCMGIMTLHGYSIPGEVYAWTAVLVLPINSAINPFLYTLMAIISKKSFNPSEDEQSRPEDIEEKRSAFLRACQGLWFPDPNIKYGVHQLTSDIITQLKPAERLMIFAKMFKSLHLHHRHGLLFKNLDTEKVLVYLRGGQIISGGGLRIINKPTPFSRKTESKQDMYNAGILLRPLTK